MIGLLAILQLSRAEAPSGSPAPADTVAPVAPDLVPPRDTLEARFDELERQMDALEAQIATLETALDRMEHRQASVPVVAAERTAAGQPVVIERDEVVSKAVAFGAPVTVYGTVTGDAVAMGSDVIVGAEGRVLGNAVSMGGRVDVTPGGFVQGAQKAVAYGPVGALGLGAAPTEPLGWLHDLARRAAVLLSFAAAGVLVVGAWPAQVSRVTEALDGRMVWYGLAGGILTAALLLGAGVLTLTLLGAPLALVLLAVLAAGWLLGAVGVCEVAGERFGGSGRRARWATFLLGASLLGLVALMPAVGTALVIMAGLPGLGAALLTRFGARTPRDR